MSDRLTGRDRCGYSPSGKSRGCLLGRGHGGRHQYKPTPASQPCAGCAALQAEIKRLSEWIAAHPVVTVSGTLAQSQPDWEQP